MSILITGGAGFVASHLTELLLQATHETIVLLDNFDAYYDPAWKRDNLQRFADNSRVIQEEGDFCQESTCRRIFEQTRPEVVIHLGAMPGVPFSLQEPERYVRINLGGTTTLLEAAREFPVKRFLFASSSTVYGVGAKAPFVEDDPLGVPASPYGATKRAAEIMGQTYHRLFGVPFTSLRLFNVYGPRIRPDLALYIFTKKILRGESLPLFGDGTVLRDFTHVRDICRGFLAAMQAENIGGECLNLGHNEPVAIKRLIELIGQAAGCEPRIDYRPERAGDMPLTCANLEKSQRLLNYHPQVTIEEGVRDYVQWFQAHAIQ
jgi:UDP-glucuronate 4-epimerase